MKTFHFFIFAFLYILILTGCKSYPIDYRGPDEQKTYSIDKDKISKKEKAAWKKATDTNSVNSYKEYIRTFSDGKYVAEAQNNIDRANDRYDELYTFDSLNTYDQNLATLFSLPIDKSQEIEIIVLDRAFKGIIANAEVQIISTCNNKEQNFTTDKSGRIIFKAQKGCCYDIKVEKKEYKTGSKQICTDELKKDYVNFFIQEKPSKITSGSAKVVFNKFDNKYYDTKTGKPFTGFFEGKKIVNGVEEVDDKKSASSEEILWKAIANAPTTEAARKKMKDYLQKFPNGKHANDVASMLEDLDQTAGSESGSTGGNSDDELFGEKEDIEEENEEEESNPPISSVVGTDPILAPTDTITQVTTLSEECAINVKSKGLLAYNTLETSMKMDTSYALEILINDLLSIDQIRDAVEESTGEELDTNELIHEGTTTIGDNVVEMIRIGSWMRVTLSEPKNQNAFSISNVYETDEENLRGKNIDCDMNVKWKFLIAPIKEGKHKLLLNFYIKNKEDDPYKVLLDEEKIISVKVKKPWYAQIWAIGIFAIGLLSMILLWWRNKKKKQPDQIFGANLGIAGGLEKVATPPTKPKSIFIAYAKEDEEWTRQIYNQMKVLHKGGYANIWYDQLMEAGAEYKAEIFKHLEESDIIMLNISSDFLACDFCDELLSKAMERHERGEGVVLIPIIVRPCLWATTPLAKMMVFPQNKKPLSDAEWKNSDNAIVNVMNEMENKILN